MSDLDWHVTAVFILVAFSFWRLNKRLNALEAWLHGRLPLPEREETPAPVPRPVPPTTAVDDHGAGVRDLLRRMGK